MERESSLPYGSVLTAPPRVKLRMPCVDFVKFTKLFLLFSILGCFVENTFAAELRVHGIHLPRGKIEGSSEYEPQASHVDHEGTPSSSSSLPSPNPISSRRRGPDVVANTIDSSTAHRENMLNGIAQDIYHHPTEMNFYESKWQEKLMDWSKGQQPNFSALLNSNFWFARFAETELGWTGMDCRMEIKGCKHMPPPEYIRRHFSNSPARAREMIFTLDAFSKLHRELAIYQEALHAARGDLDMYCREFAETFSHKKTKGTKKMCLAQILQIVMGVIGALIAIATLAKALHALVPLFAGEVASISAIGAAEIAEVEISESLLTTIVEETETEIAALDGVESSISSGSSSGWATEEIFEQAYFHGVDDWWDWEAAYAPRWIGASPWREEIIGSSLGVLSTMRALYHRVLEAIEPFYEILSRIATWARKYSDLPTQTWEEAFPSTEFPSFAAAELTGGLRKRAAPATAMSPRWAGYQLDPARLNQTMLEAKAYSWSLLAGPEEKLIEGLGRVIYNTILLWNTNGTKVAVNETYHEMRTWSQDLLVDKVLYERGKTSGAPNATAWAVQEKMRIMNETIAFNRMLDASMNSFTKVKDDKTPAPKQFVSFGQFEWFSTDVSFDVRGDSSIYSKTNVQSQLVSKRYPKSNDSSEVPQDDSQDFMGLRGGTDWSNTTDSTKNYVSRFSKLFTLFEHKADNKTKPSIRSAYSLGARIAHRMQEENGDAMSAERAMQFFEKQTNEINRRVELLRRGEGADGHDAGVILSVFKNVDIRTPRTPMQIRVNTAMDTLPWSSILGNTNFEGFSLANAVDTTNPELKWSAKRSSQAAAAAHLGKREAFTVHSHLAKHEIRGTLNLFESLGLIAKPVNSKRSRAVNDGINIESRQSGSDEIFVAEVHGQLFKSEIHIEKCGTDSYTGSTANNEQACHTFLKDTVDQIDKQIAASSDFKNAAATEFARIIGLRYSTYTNFRNADAIAVDKPAIKEKLRKDLMNSLISKAWADQNCYMRCRPTRSLPGEEEDPREGIYTHEGTNMPNGTHIICTTGCYDAIKGNFARVYGFEGTGKAATGTWGLDEKRINRASWEAYINRDPASSLPGRVDLNPYQHNVKDDNPILAVCFSREDTSSGVSGGGIPTNCGDRFSSEFFDLVSAGNWVPEGEKEEQTALRHAFKPLKYMSKSDAPAYLINMCYVHYFMLIPPGGSYIEKNKKGHYSENYKNCQQYMALYESNKGNTASEDFKNKMEALWNPRRKDNPTKDWATFNHVNRALKITNFARPESEWEGTEKDLYKLGAWGGKFHEAEQDW